MFMLSITEQLARIRIVPYLNGQTSKARSPFAVSSPRFFLVLDWLVSFQHGQPVHHGRHGVANLRIDRLAFADRFARIGARYTANGFAFVRRPARRRDES